MLTRRIHSLTIPYRLPLLSALLLTAVCALFSLGGAAFAQSEEPAAPTGLTAPTVAHDSVTLSWNDPGDTSITGYKILRRNPETDAPGVFASINDNTGTSATSYTDGTVQPLTKYVYRVKAIYGSG